MHVSKINIILSFHYSKSCNFQGSSHFEKLLNVDQMLNFSYTKSSLFIFVKPVSIWYGLRIIYHLLNFPGLENSLSISFLNCGAWNNPIFSPSGDLTTQYKEEALHLFSWRLYLHGFSQWRLWHFDHPHHTVGLYSLELLSLYYALSCWASCM